MNDDLHDLHDLGRLERGTPPGAHRLRFTRALAHPPEKVWRALTEPEHLAAWFPSAIHGERRAGAPLEFVFENDPDHPTAGEMLEHDPPRLLELRWEAERLRFELEPDGAGGTILTFVNTFDELGKAARDAAGWHVCLDALSARLSGTVAVRSPEQAWTDVEGRYIEAFGPEAATIGPPGASV